MAARAARLALVRASSRPMTASTTAQCADDQHQGWARGILHPGRRANVELQISQAANQQPQPPASAMANMPTAR